MIFDFTLSAPFIFVIVTQICGALWAWFSVKTKSDIALKTAEEAMEKAKLLEIQVLREYATLQNIQSVETRLAYQIGELTSEIRELRRFLMDKKG